MMIERSPNLSAVRRKSYEAVLRFQIYKVKRECRGFSMCAGLGVSSRLVIFYLMKSVRDAVVAIVS